MSAPKKAAASTKEAAATPSDNTKHAVLQEETAVGTVYYLDAAARDRVKARAKK